MVISIMMAQVKLVDEFEMGISLSQASPSSSEAFKQDPEACSVASSDPALNIDWPYLAQKS